MPKAVQLSAYGGIEQLAIVEVPKPAPAAGEVVVRVVAAGTNPGEISIREGHLKDRWPMALPFGQGTDFAGQVDAVGAGVTEFKPGDDVLGWSEERAAQAEFVRSTPQRLAAKPPALDWFRAGSLFVAGVTAVAAVGAVALKPGDVVAVSGAAGGVGSFAVQLAGRTGARVIGIAGNDNASFLRSVGAEHVAYGDGLAERLRALAPNGIEAFIDLFGGGYIDLAVELGVVPDRIDTIIDFAAAAKHGAKTDGSSAASDRETLALLANLIAWGEIVMPIAAVYPFAAIKDAYSELARRKTHGKVVLAIGAPISQPLHPPAWPK
jgi:NADPH:quinone reductase-like Zn-dependent oxidoreductase